jgi:hypothetical protein
MLIQKYQKKLNEYFSKSLTKLYDKPLPSLTQEESRFIEELRSDFQKLPVLISVGSSASERQWIDNSNTLRNLVLNEDPREFLRWHVISSSMFVKYGGYINHEYKYLSQQSDWDSRWSKAVVETHTGHPLPYYQYPKSSANLIHHAYHLAIFEQKTGINLSDVDFILEFGGGYGSMCRLAYNLDFSGKYIIYDIPAFNALQKFFLKSIGIKVLAFENFTQQTRGVFCISDNQHLEQILSKDSVYKKTLFIGTWSISETPYKIRDLILPLISDFHAFLIAYQERFHETDNTEFFKKWIAFQNSIEWYDWAIEHMPGNRYLMGRKKIE